MILIEAKQLEGPKKGGGNDEHDKKIEKEVSTPSNDVIVDDMHNSNGVPKDSKYTS